MIIASIRAGLDSVSLLFSAIVVGVLVGYASLGFLLAIDWLHEWFVGEKGAALYF